MSDVCELPSLPGLCSTATHRTVRVVEQVQLARDTFRLRLESPEIARQIVPGQFVMIREPGTTNPLLGRPFALYDTYLDAQGNPAGIDVVYLVLGKMTRLMSGWREGDKAELWGPLGNGFPPASSGPLLLVAGGIGVTPFLAVARAALALRKYGLGEWEGERVGGFSAPTLSPSHPPKLCYGVRSAEYLAGLDDFAALGIDVQIATDDGTRGHHGFVTDLVQKTLTQSPSTLHPPIVYCCGPEPMMHAVAEIAAKYDAPCYLSLETPMACGFGACFSCVTRVRLDDGTWDYRRVCVEGPIFPAPRLAW